MMKHGKSNIGIRRSQKGFALVVILAFMVLLTVLVLAYFSYSSLQRQISSANSNQATVNVFSQGAINTIVSDLKQEIFTNSTVVTVGTNTITIPLAQSNAVPVRVGTSTNLPNLVKRSAGGLAFFAGGPARASSSSTTNASQNGRSISSARWNAAMLLPKAATNTTDLTPANFTPPDWIYVNRNGGNPTSWSPDMAWSGGVTNSNTVIGRYAYAIYDEGGLLDVNVAGSPPGMTNSAVGYKNSLAFADLSLIGLNSNMISALVGWRNKASAQPAGSFPDYTFPPASQTNYLNSVANNSTGYMRVGNTSLSGSESDRQFISRQQLIQFFQTLAEAGLETKPNAQNALQFLGTFSRGLEQPSFSPDPARPKIIGSSAPPAATLVDSYRGNNDAWGGDDQINPPFLSIRATSDFTRWDGSKAVVNEPLVKKRFALERLTYLTFEGPSSTASSATKSRLLASGVRQEIIDAGTPDNIKKCFGLTWGSLPGGGGKGWTYEHGSSAIRTLEQVTTAGREPDFVELVKAAISAGSLAKGGPNLKNHEGNYQYTLDTTLDYNVLQIVANLIDQNDADSYPTQIQVSAGPVQRTFRGVEDLPYFYRYHPMTVVTRLPSPLLSKADKVDWRQTGNPVSSAPFKTTFNCAPGTLSDPGEAVFLYVPDVWNPHDAGTATTANWSRPSRFRLVVISRDPLEQTPAWNTGTIPKVDGDWYDDIPPKASIPANLAPLSESTTSFTFGDHGGALFREPTLLWRNDAPANAGIAADAGSKAGPHVDANTGVSYYGVQIGKTPVSFVSQVGPAYYGTPTAPGGSYIFQASALEPNQQLPVGAYAQYTFRLQYQDPNGSGWITYDEKYPDFHGLYRPTLVVNTLDFPNNIWKNPYRSGQMNDCSTGYDPRTARFGIGTATSLDWSGSPMLEPGATANFYSDTSQGNQDFADSKATVMVTQRPKGDRGNRVNYSNPGMTSDPGRNQEMRFFSGVGFSASNGQNGAPLQFDGLWAQNNPALRIQNRTDSGLVQFFYEDADGIARRAMGAYAISPSLPAAQSSAADNNLQGLPHATANTYAPGSLGIGSPTAQNQSRPMILNRPFRSVGEMSYTFRGGLWKQLDFFTPESGDAALLDVFCISEPPSDAIVAGKVNLNTRQPAVLKAILAGAYREELANHSGSLPAGTLQTALDATEAGNAANKLVSITTDTTNAWRGPLANISQIVGRFVPNPGAIGSATDVYQFTEPVTKVNYTYAGFSAALDSSVYGSATAATIQRLREAAIRPLASVGQVRVWNLMVDVVAQVGRYPASATSMDQFTVEGEARFWVHLAIDRMTGEVIDKQVELVTE